MRAVIFTHPRDYGIATVAARSLIQLGVSPVLAVDERDPVPEIEGIEVIVTSFQRVGNLNGTDCVRGILRTLAKCADGDTYVMKVDSDTLVRGLSWLAGRTEPAVGFHHPEVREFYGACYAIRRDMLRDYRAAAEALPESPNCPEDETIGTLLPGAYRFINRDDSCPFAAWSEVSAADQSKEVLVFNPGDHAQALREMRRLS